MEIKKLNISQDIAENKKLTKKCAPFEILINELNKKDIPSGIGNSINHFIDEINAFSGSDKDLLKQISKQQASILKLIEKELKLVPKKLYMSRWLAIGMSAFGVPFGVVFGTAMDNMGYLGIGLPIGMVIGMVIGVGMDKKALNEGRQLDVEIQY